MRAYDLSPLYRATVGFDRMSDLMERVMRADSGASGGYPPYNIEKTGEDAYRLSLAVAGFTADELTVELRQNALVIAAAKAKDDSPRTYLHRGIATRSFEKTFELADHMFVSGATHENGMLHVDLARKMPEALKPRRIEITSTAPKHAAIEGTA